jgi:hypothetical protein
MAAKCIVNFRSWGKIDSKTWDYILEQLMNGKPVGIWSGHYPDIPKDWVIGKCSLRVKVGKKRKLVCGRIAIWADGYDDVGDCYVIEFTPSRIREMR